MQKTLMLITTALVLMAGVLAAQSDADYQGWMKGIAASNGAMGTRARHENPTCATVNSSTPRKCIGLPPGDRQMSPNCATRTCVGTDPTDGIARVA